MNKDRFGILETTEYLVENTCYELFFNARSFPAVIEKNQNKNNLNLERSNAEWYAENLSGINASEWEIGVKDVKDPLAEHGHGDLLFIICLNDDESKQLTLGRPKNLGGDFTEDRMFCMDIDTFFHTYKKIPKRVAKMLIDLEGYVPNKSQRRFRSSSERGFEIL